MPILAKPTHWQRACFLRIRAIVGKEAKELQRKNALT
jgi:hypothetical protein